MTLTSGVLWRHYVPVPLSVKPLLILLASNQPYCACAYIWDGILSQGESKIYSYFFFKKSLCQKSCVHIIKTPTRLESIVCLVDGKGIWEKNLLSLVTEANKGGFVWFTFKQRFSVFGTWFDVSDIIINHFECIGKIYKLFLKIMHGHCHGKPLYLGLNLSRCILFIVYFPLDQLLKIISYSGSIYYVTCILVLRDLLGNHSLSNSFPSFFSFLHLVLAYI